MYSRPVLLQSLREQKMQSARLMKVMASQTIQIESMSTALEAEIQKRKKLEKTSKAAEEENRRGRMASHHMQSEIQRLETIVEVTRVYDILNLLLFSNIIILYTRLCWQSILIR
jgi:hypothetical protein